MMKIKLMALCLCMCLMCLLTGCAEKKTEAEKPVPTVRIAQGAYQYDHGYQLAEGWMYDMTISADKQMAELDALVSAAVFEPTGEDFLVEVGYRLAWYDAEGNMTRELLVLSAAEASMDGMMYRMSNADGLAGWLDALKLAEQDVTE